MALSRATRFYRQVVYFVLARYDVRWGYLPESIVTLIEKLHVLQYKAPSQYCIQQRRGSTKCTSVHVQGVPEYLVPFTL